MDPAAIGGLVAAIAVPIGIALLARLFPTQPVAPGERPFADLHAEFWKWQLIQGLLVLVAIPVATFVWWQLLLGLGAWLAVQLPPANYRPLPGRAAWALPALFAGIVSAGPVAERIFRALLGERYRDFVRYQDLQFHLDSRAVSKPFYLALAIPCAVFVLLMADFYVYLTPTEIVVDRFFRLREERFAYSEVTEIATFPIRSRRGKGEERLGFVIRFRDGRSWSTKGEPSDAPTEIRAAIAEYVSHQSGVRVKGIGDVE